MIFENTEVFNFEGALRGMRNPLESWERSDSDFSDKCHLPEHDMRCSDCPLFRGFGKQCSPLIGKNDLALAQRLIRGGSEHRKFMRQIFICVDITAPSYWWKEADTYGVGVVKNSTSTMHKIQSKAITLELFETDDYNSEITEGIPELVILPFLEKLRVKFLETKDKRYWKELIRWTPHGWLFKRTTTLNYENIFNIVHQRKNHKLNEWSGKDNPEFENFIAWAKTLPYANELIFLEKETE